MHLPFDSNEITSIASDVFHEVLNSSDFVTGSFIAGPINEAYCTSDSGSMELSVLNSNCFHNFENCSNGFSLTFWIRSPSIDHFTSNMTYSLILFDGLSLSYKHDGKNANRLTLIIEKRNTTSRCKYHTAVPSNVWFHLGLVVRSSVIDTYISGNETAVFTYECDANNAYVRNKVVEIGGGDHSFCIDDLSVWLRPLSNNEISKTYKKGRGDAFFFYMPF